MCGDYGSESDPAAFHGSLGKQEWGLPTRVTELDVNNRLSFTSIKAHEYCDTELVLRAKVEMLAHLIRHSKACIAYTGAGISTAAGIDDYATKSKGESITALDEPALKDWKKARPTKAHKVLVAMYEAGHLKHWVQQNHDSLPQKAGYPQHALNEIHGSLHDPSNPIVPYEGSLRDDLYEWMEHWQRTSDLCITLGSSLSGFTSDGVAEAAARRHREGNGLGLVIINLQQTPYDDDCALRIFGKADDVMSLLAEELAITSRVQPMSHVHVPCVDPAAVVEEDVFLVPFDQQGRPTKAAVADDTLAAVAAVDDGDNAGGGEHCMRWDLRVGQWVQLTGGPYAGDKGQITAKHEDGHYRILFCDSLHPSFNARRAPFALYLGGWFVEEATRGHTNCPGGRIPFVNTEPPARERQSERRGGRGGQAGMSVYTKLSAAGVPEGAVRLRMANAGVAAEEIDQFFAPA
jgi:NAD-dependent SIR2 family protein deacetylase